MFDLHVPTFTPDNMDCSKSKLILISSENLENFLGEGLGVLVDYKHHEINEFVKNKERIAFFCDTWKKININELISKIISSNERSLLPKIPKNVKFGFINIDRKMLTADPLQENEI